jgi:Family of unknown function (DUF5317)
MDFRRPLVTMSRFWRIPVILAIGAFAVYQFKTGAWTDSWTSVGAGVFLCLGLALNLVVLILNNGFMPVRMKTIPRDYQTSHKAIDSRTRAWFLGDWIRVAQCYLSPGDLCLVAALALRLAEELLGVFGDAP